ncbi:hypothetical protein A2524_03515 [Candidatus Wolfebacteria bacterium RIFOXYD12_FULL_48_21]|nr:MAG: hypothetical protein A2524_03515 [Candidatus Wolfebacteria bacterium RIFOXYD12_FULL_48_21]OGM97269.1 MAG: hypothetical protein A2532_03315 [Candidatus Wolfebacteria bacterium RIFOXYD2_FULL_48_11]
MTIANGANYRVRERHLLHSHCAIEFDVVSEARKDLSAVFEKMPEAFFADSTIAERLSKVFTKDGLRSLLLSLADMLREKKDMLRQALQKHYKEFVVQLCAAANHIRLGHELASALA